MSDKIQNKLSPIFSRFKDFPTELRCDIWFHALPGPRIVFVERYLTSGQDAQDEYNAKRQTFGPLAPEPTRFISQNSNNERLLSLLQTCQESRSTVTANYTLFLPKSSTWFSFSTDFLYLDFCRTPHALIYSPATFTTSLPRRTNPYPRDPQYLRPLFDEGLAKRVKNIAIANNAGSSFVDNFWTVFSGVDLVVLVDQLHNTCSEVKEELVWMGSHGEISLSFQESDQRKTEMERERAISQGLRSLYLWAGTGHQTLRKGDKVALFEQQFAESATQCGRLPTIVRNGIITANMKKRLIELCGSPDNFQHLSGLDHGYILGRHEYHGPFNKTQLIAFLEMALKRQTTACSWRAGQGCFDDEPPQSLVAHVPEILSRLDALGGGFENIRLREAENAVWN